MFFLKFNLQPLQVSDWHLWLTFNAMSKYLTFQSSRNQRNIRNLSSSSCQKSNGKLTYISSHNFMPTTGYESALRRPLTLSTTAPLTEIWLILRQNDEITAAPLTIFATSCFQSCRQRSWKKEDTRGFHDKYHSSVRLEEGVYLQPVYCLYVFWLNYVTNFQLNF